MSVICILLLMFAAHYLKLAVVCFSLTSDAFEAVVNLSLRADLNNGLCFKHNFTRCWFSSATAVIGCWYLFGADRFLCVVISWSKPNEVLNVQKMDKVPNLKLFTSCWSEAAVWIDFSVIMCINIRHKWTSVIPTMPLMLDYSFAMINTVYE